MVTVAERLDALFVQSASAFSSAEGEITLHGVANATVYFSDVPRREAGHIASAHFLDFWSGDKARFVVEPPHAVLSFLEGEAGAPADVVLVLHEPHLANDELTYRVEVLNGTLPLAGGPCSLFVDAFDRSLAPASVRGVRRPRQTSAS